MQGFPAFIRVHIERQKESITAGIFPLDTIY